MYHHCTLRVDPGSKLDYFRGIHGRILTIDDSVSLHLPLDPAKALAVLALLRAALDEAEATAQRELVAVSA